MRSDVGLVLRAVRELEVDVDEGALHLRQLLQLLLQRLPDVVRLAERHVAGEHHVHLHELVRPEGVCPHGVDVPDILVVVPDEVRELGQVLRRRRPPDQRAYVLQHRSRPRRDRVQRGLHAFDYVDYVDYVGQVGRLSPSTG